MSLTVQHLVRAMRTYELPHELAGSERIRVGTAPREQKGARGLRVVTKRAPKVLTLTAAGTPGDALKGLPDAYRKAPSIVAAESRGEIRFIDEKPPEQAPKEPAAPAAPEPTTQGRPGRARGGEK